MTNPSSLLDLVRLMACPVSRSIMATSASSASPVEASNTTPLNVATSMGCASSGKSTSQKSRLPLLRVVANMATPPRGATIKLLSFPGLLTLAPRFVGVPHVPSFSLCDMNTSSFPNPG